MNKTFFRFPYKKIKLLYPSTLPSSSTCTYKVENINKVNRKRERKSK